MNLNLEIKPSQQGELDYLCGIYSLVNAVAYLYEGNVRRRYLKQSLLQIDGVKWPLNELLKEGMDEDEIDYLIEEDLLKGRYHLARP